MYRSCTYYMGTTIYFMSTSVLDVIVTIVEKFHGQNNYCFPCLVFSWHIILWQRITKGLQPSQKIIERPQVYRFFFMIQIYFHALLFIWNRSLLCIFFCIVYREILRFTKYIEILDLVSVGQYWTIVLFFWLRGLLLWSWIRQERFCTRSICSWICFKYVGKYEKK